MHSSQSRGLTGKLVVWSFIAIVLAAIVYVVVNRDRDPALAISPAPTTAAFAGRDDDLLAAESPQYPGEGAVGLLEDQENAGAAVNPITPTGRAGGPAGQTPAYGQPAGVPSRIISE